MAYEDRNYFRNKQIATRAKWHQKILRPLAAWVERNGPIDFIQSGLLIAVPFSMVRLIVINWYAFSFIFPWVVLGVALVLAGASWALRRGSK